MQKVASRWIERRTSSPSDWFLSVVLQPPRQRLAGGCARRLRHVHYGSTPIERLWWVVNPGDPRRVHCDVIPDDGSAIMFAHQMRDESAFVPILGGPQVGDPLQG